MDKFLEPGLFEAYDMALVDSTENGRKKKRLEILCRVGDYLSLEIIDIGMAKRETNEESHIESYQDKHYRAYSFNWPYFTYGTKFKRIFILNAFNSKFIQCYELPKNVTIISEAFLTDTHDYYCICESQDYNFHIYHIDLDDVDPRLSLIHQYSMASVGNKPASHIHCRGGSHKEKVNLNKLLVIYIMHGNDIYCWIQGNQDLQVVSKGCKNFYYMSEDSIFYMTAEKREVHGHG